MTSLETEHAQNTPAPVDRFMFQLLMNIEGLVMGILKMRRSWLAFCFFLSAALLVDTFDAWAFEVTDVHGRKIHFASPPQRIVSLVPAVTEMLFALDAGDRVVGVTYHDTLPGAADEAVVGGFFSPSMDRIVALNPDVVMVSSLHEEIVRQCDDLGLATLNLDLSSISRSRDTIAALGILVQREDAAEALQHKIQAQLDLIARKTAAIPKDERLRVMRLMGRDRVMTPGDDSFQNEMIRAAGAIPPVLGKRGGAVAVSLDEWQRFNPQVIYGCYDDRETAARFFDQAGWTDVDAVRNHRVYYFPCELTCRAGAHTGDFVSWLAARLYGDRFARPEGVVEPDRVIARRPVSVTLPYVKRAEVIDSRIYDFTHKTLLVEFSNPMKMVSTLDGPREAMTAVGNHFFPSPCWYIGHQSGLDGLRSKVCQVLARQADDTALMFTGVDMDNLSIQRQAFREMIVYALVTAGARSNALRAAKDTGAYYEPGTINVLVMSNMQLTPRAMTRAIVAATEAKTAALEDLDIRSSYTPGINGATGTGTDNVIVVQGIGTVIDNTGGHTKMGELISRVVYQGVREALYGQNGFHAHRNILQRLKERNISILGLLNQNDCPCGLKPHQFAAAMETRLLDPAWASFLAAALAVSDDWDRGLISDLTAFQDWARGMAEQTAGGPMEAYDDLISSADLPPVLYIALNALANGVKAGRLRQQSE
jgi:iron complex transport system substrate-binding protein